MTEAAPEIPDLEDLNHGLPGDAEPMPGDDKAATFEDDGDDD